MSKLLDAQDKLQEIKARLAALQHLFMFEDKRKQFGSEACWGIDLTIQKIEDELDVVKESLSTADKPEAFGQLSVGQQGTITDLIRDILDGFLSPVSVATKDTARIALARFEGAAARLSAEECAQELAGYEFDVTFEMTPETPGDGYILGRKLTLKGLRHDLARERFFETITCGGEGDE